jgi:hypothetical protein
MKYFLDTEFIEGTQKRPLILKGRLGNWMIGYPKPTIDLISIGIVSEDNREYYAISKDFNLNEAWNRWQQRTGEGDRNNIEPREYWIRENVLRPIFNELTYLDRHDDKHSWFTYKNFKYLINKYGKTNKQIAEEIIKFTSPVQNIDKTIPDHLQVAEQFKIDRSNPEFYAYYADYDWVAFCWLFGKMIDLPRGFPKYCIDLKQMLDEKAIVYDDDNYSQLDIKGKVEYLKTNSKYPKQTNEHNALADARWNKELYEFLNKL